MIIYLDIDENQIIQDVKFKTFGCGAAGCNFQYGNRNGKGKICSGGNGSNEQSGYGSVDGLPPGKGTLLPCLLKKQSMQHSGVC